MTYRANSKALSRTIKNRRSVKNSWSFPCVSPHAVTSATIGEKFEQFGFDFRKMLDRAYIGAVNVGENTNDVIALMQTNKS